MKPELEGAELDAAVATIEGVHFSRCLEEAPESWNVDRVYQLLREGQPEDGRQKLILYSPSTDWRQGGPILDREPIISGYCGDADNTPWPGQWYAQLDDETRGGNCHSLGPTRLIAAMRCFVRSKTPNV